MIVESLSVAVRLHDSNSRAKRNHVPGKPAVLPVLPLAIGIQAWHLLPAVLGRRRPLVSFCRQLMYQLCQAFEYNELYVSLSNDSRRQACLDRDKMLTSE
jgi:hypothetical protein